MDTSARVNKEGVPQAPETAGTSAHAAATRPSASTVEARSCASMTVEEFDRLEGGHVFSEGYEARKRALLAEVAAGQHGDVRKPRRLTWKVALVAAAALVALPVTAWAVIDNSGFFNGAFGSDGRVSVESHDEIQGYKEGVPIDVTYPAREYVDVDAEAAERLLGPYVASDPMTVQLGDHTLTLLSTVRDGDTMVASYTLEREGGVTALDWDELTNQAKGARVPEDAPVWTRFEAGVAPVMKAARDELLAEPDLSGENRAAYEEFGALNTGSGYIIVDPERSTADKLYCYEYVIFDEGVSPDTPITLQAFFSNGTEQTFDVSTKEAVPYRELAGPDGAKVRLSPLGLSFDGLSFDTQDAIRDIVISYHDGTTYTVLGNDPYVDNTSNVLGGRETANHGGLGGVYTLLFNRLVDPEAVAGITIGGRDLSSITFA